jgi:hypothetical protein
MFKKDFVSYKPLKTFQCLFLFLFAVLNHGNFKAQMPLTDSSESYKNSIGIYFSPDYCYRNLSAKEDYYWMMTPYDTLEVGKLGYTFGFQFNRKVFPALELSAGIAFSDRGERTRKYVIPPANNYINHYYYLDVPISVRAYPFLNNYYIKKNPKLFFYFLGGLQCSIFLNHKLERQNTFNEIETISTRGYVSKVNLGFLLGLGVNYNIQKQLALKAEPILRHSINSVSKAPVKKHLYSVGLQLGLSYRF